MSTCCNVLRFSGLQNGPVIQVLVRYSTVGKNKVCKERVLMKLIYGLSAANAFLSYVWTKISFFSVLLVFFGYRYRNRSHVLFFLVSTYLAV